MEAALEYAATNVSLRMYQVVSRVFQDHFRATIHPKPGQIGVPRSGSTVAWNGIGVWNPAQAFPEGIQARMFGELGRDDMRWATGYMPGDEFPSYYRELSAGEKTNEPPLPLA